MRELKNRELEEKIDSDNCGEDVLQEVFICSRK